MAACTSKGSDSFPYAMKGGCEGVCSNETDERGPVMGIRGGAFDIDAPGGERATAATAHGNVINAYGADEVCRAVSGG